MSEKKQGKIICAELPEGLKCTRYQCSDCIFYDRNDYDRDGWCYCKINHKYYPADDMTCGEFQERR